MKVSVIIPTYNREHTILRAIHSVLNQTFTDFELLVIDDGSTDNTTKLVNSLEDKRICLIELRENSGVSNARNIGIQMAKGKFIALLDSDDEWLPEKLEKQVRLLKNSKQKNLGIVGCLRLEVDSSGEIMKQSSTLYKGDVLGELLSGWMVHYNIMNSSIALIDKKVFSTVDKYDVCLQDHEDYDLWIRIANKFTFDAVGEHLTKIYRWKNVPRMPQTTYFENKFLFFTKNEHLFKKYPEIYRKKLIWLGIFAIRCNQKDRGQKLFVKVLKNSLWSREHLIASFHLLVSLFGTHFYIYMYNKFH